ncbi:hypothetical protein HK102_006048, partial [Quaeritorhiza haematococci]
MRSFIGLSLPLVILSLSAADQDLFVTANAHREQDFSPAYEPYTWQQFHHPQSYAPQSEPYHPQQFHPQQFHSRFRPRPQSFQSFHRPASFHRPEPFHRPEYAHNVADSQEFRVPHYRPQQQLHQQPQFHHEQQSLRAEYLREMAHYAARPHAVAGPLSFAPQHHEATQQHQQAAPVSAQESLIHNPSYWHPMREYSKFHSSPVHSSSVQAASAPKVQSARPSIEAALQDKSYWHPLSEFAKFRQDHQSVSSASVSAAAAPSAEEAKSVNFLADGFGHKLAVPQYLKQAAIAMHHPQQASPSQPQSLRIASATAPSFNCGISNNCRTDVACLTTCAQYAILGSVVGPLPNPNIPGAPLTGASINVLCNYKGTPAITAAAPITVFGFGNTAAPCNATITPGQTRVFFLYLNTTSPAPGAPVEYAIYDACYGGADATRENLEQVARVVTATGAVAPSGAN